MGVQVMRVPEMLKKFLCHEDCTIRSGMSLQKGASFSELCTILDQNYVKTSSTMTFFSSLYLLCYFLLALKLT